VVLLIGSQRPVTNNPTGARQYATVDPATGEHLRSYSFSTLAELDDLLEAAHQGFLAWRRWSVSERAGVLRRAAELMLERQEELAQLQTLEMGKRLVESRGEVPWVASILQYYAKHGPGFLEPEVLPVGAGEALVVHAPLGVLLAIEPWNFPLYQAVRIAAPQLLVGNTVLVKHSELCPQTALALEQLFRDAGAPAGVYTNVFLRIPDVAHVLEHPVVQGVSLTGSEVAGSAVAEIAGRNMKKCVLELGGSDPFIILDLQAGGGLEGTVAAAAAARLGNAGQSCVAAKRVIVLEPFFDRVVEGLGRHFAALTLGDPREQTTDIGPLSSGEAAARLAAQLADAINKGATVVTGGGRPDRVGAFVEPTVLTGVTPQMRAYSEELFGPVLAVYRAADDEEAVRLANSSPYGLSGVVYCSDLDRARAVADALDTGMAWINQPSGSEAGLPFGGIKRSGFGRVLSHLGILEFVNHKLVRTVSPHGD